MLLPRKESFLYGACLILLAATCLRASPQITRLTPPSELFSFGDANPPIIARFLAGQRFDLQATVRPDADQTITKVEFLIDNVLVPGTVNLTPATVANVTTGTTVATRRAFSKTTAGIHTLTARATQSNGASVTATGNFEIVSFSSPSGSVAKAKNIIIMIGDGMGTAARTAARIVGSGVSQGKVLAPLAMDRFPVTGMVQTHSLNSIVTDSAPGAAVYSTGNKNDNNQEGVFPDDTTDAFDNPRIENLGEFFARTQGKSLGIVSTADLEDATPAAFGVHTQSRVAGTGIVDQYLDETVPKANLTVLLGGGRRWFQAASVSGSGRTETTDYSLPTELASAWNVPAGKIDPERDLITDFKTAGFTYVGSAKELKALPASTVKLIGLFHPSHMNTALDKIAARRGRSSIVTSNGYPDQPMLEEMTTAALNVLSKNPNGFVLMIEAGNIDKQAHAMDTERWLLEILEFDRAIERVRQFTVANPDTLAIITADHETGGISLVGASTVSNSTLQALANISTSAGEMRDGVVGTYSSARFPNYKILSDGYPDNTDVDYKLLVTYGANADRYEDWTTKATPTANPTRGWLIPGQVPGSQAVHTASDIPLSAMGIGSTLFSGNFDNTEIFFKAAQLAIVGQSTSTTVASAVISGTRNNNLLNLSTRGFAGSGEDALFGGFVVNGPDGGTFLIRAIGPTLRSYGVKNALDNPLLQIINSGGALIHSSNGREIAANAADAAYAATKVGAFTIAPDSGDAVLLVTLPPGTYRTIVRGANGETGVALLELYQIP